jgi:hypothetical protein
MAKSSPLSGRIGPRFGGRGARKRSKIIVASIFIITAGTFATTLAANVTINQNTALEFGQGQVPAIACDQSITTAISEEWNNSTTNFHVKTVTLSGLNIASPNPSAIINDQGCGGKTLRVSLLNTEGTPLPMGSGSPTQIAFTVPTAVGTAATVSPAGATVVISGTSPTYTATITLPTSTPSADVRATATAVARVTIETD